jgi:hypothetical protein
VSQFQQPGISSPEDKFVPADSNGALLLFFPTQLQTGIKTAHGAADAVAATVVRLNDGRVFENALIFPTALVTQLKAAVPDGMVLGTLGQGENTKGNPPWLLSPHTEADVAIAEAWLAVNPRNQFAQPQAQAAPPTAAAPAPAWGQQPPAAAPAAPATGGWGNPPAAAPAPAWGAQPAAPATTPAVAPPAATAGAWGAGAPAPAPAASIDPGLVAALQARGVDPAQLTSQAQAEGIAAAMGLTRG